VERSAQTSREAATECSPRRKPWDRKWETSKPRRGERKVATQSLQRRVKHHQSTGFSPGGRLPPLFHKSFCTIVTNNLYWDIRKRTMESCARFAPNVLLESSRADYPGFVTQDSRLEVHSSTTLYFARLCAQDFLIQYFADTQNGISTKKSQISINNSLFCKTLPASHLDPILCATSAGPASYKIH
jgi:hypothetical protein